MEIRGFPVTDKQTNQPSKHFPESFSHVSLRPKISEELRTLILRMLDKNPDSRITIPEIKVTKRTKAVSEGEPGVSHLLFRLAGS